MAITTRVATLADVDAMAEVHHRSFVVAARTSVPDWVMALRSVEGRADLWRQIFSSLKVGDPQPGLAEMDGRIVGVTWPGRDEQDRTLGFLHYHYVDPDLRGRGIGTALLEFCYAQFREVGIDHAILLVFKENADAQRFYGRHGWRFTGEQRIEPDDHTGFEVTALVMAKDL